MKNLTLCIAALLLAGVPAIAQDVTGSISGYVSDPGSLPIAGATITLKNVKMQTERSVVTDERGGFEFVAVAPGTYDLTAEKAGFKKLLSSGYELKTTQRLSVG